MLFLHKARWPLFPEFDNPEVFGFARDAFSNHLPSPICACLTRNSDCRVPANRVRNLYLRTPDGIRIGVWHVLPQSVSSRYGTAENLADSVFEEVLRDPKHCVMLYMHGNAGNRAQGHRKHLAKHVSSEPLNMNFVTFDYRGYGDSSNVNPSEEGLLIDSRTIWDWLTQDMGVAPSQIVLAGQSMGTGVACALAGRSLAPEGDLLLAYKLAEFIPVLQPLRYFSRVREYLFSFLDAHFESLSIIRHIRCPILLIHCIVDGAIPYEHSVRLFKHLCEDNTRVTEQFERLDTQSVGRYARLDKLVAPKDNLDVQFLEMHFGGHDNVGYSEVALQTMKDLIYDR